MILFNKLLRRRHVAPAIDQQQPAMLAEWTGNMLTEISKGIAKRKDEIAELENLQQLFDQHDDLKNQISAAESKLTAIQQQQTDALELVESSKALVAKSKAEVARVMADLPGEVARHRGSVEVLAALCDCLKGGRRYSTFLAKLGWMPNRGGPGFIRSGEMGIKTGQQILSALADEVTAPSATAMSNEWQVDEKIQRTLGPVPVLA